MREATICSIYRAAAKEMESLDSSRGRPSERKHQQQPPPSHISEPFIPNDASIFLAFQPPTLPFFEKPMQQRSTAESHSKITSHAASYITHDTAVSQPKNTGEFEDEAKYRAFIATPRAPWGSLNRLSEPQAPPQPQRSC